MTLRNHRLRARWLLLPFLALDLQVRLVTILPSWVVGFASGGQARFDRYLMAHEMP
jgi:hypothetical protein